jgi:hypothetical protein
MTCDPASPTALATSGQTSSLRETRTRARRRRCAHHGTDKMSPPITSACESGEANGPSAVAADSHTPPGSADVGALALGGGVVEADRRRR